MNELFTLYKVDEQEVGEIQKQAIEPHQHDFEELLIGVEGELEHFIDFRSEIVSAPFISFITQGKIHKLVPRLKDGKCCIYALRFKSEFVAQTTFQLYTSFHDNANICVACTGCFKRLDTLCQLIEDEYRRPSPEPAILRQLLNTVIVMVESERQKAVAPTDTNTPKVQSITFKNFLRLLEQHYHEPYGVNFYAERLFMTVRNLNLICSNILHQSVSEIIETRKLTEAKNLLITSEKTIAEIGYELGYNEKTYFTHAFKKKAGITPSEFRKEMKKLIS